MLLKTCGKVIVMQYQANRNLGIAADQLYGRLESIHIRAELWEMLNVDVNDVPTDLPDIIGNDMSFDPFSKIELYSNDD